MEAIPSEQVGVLPGAGPEHGPVDLREQCGAAVRDDRRAARLVVLRRDAARLHRRLFRIQEAGTLLLRL